MYANAKLLIMTFISPDVGTHTTFDEETTPIKWIIRYSISRGVRPISIDITKCISFHPVQPDEYS